MKRTITIGSLCALVVVVAFSFFLATRHPISEATSEPSPLLGKSAPAVNATEIGGRHFSLKKDRGKVVVLNFWASWCEPCVVEAPNLSTFAWQQRHKDVVVVGVVFNDSVSAATSFAAHYGSLYPSVVDPGGAVANRYGVTSPPTTFVIDAEGRVEATLLGSVTVAQLDRVVKRVEQ